MFVRGRYGHGGRVGYDREWRADPARSGGGELIDQGVHLIDLAALVSRRLRRRRRLRARPTSGTCRSTTTRSCAAHRARPGRVPARELHRVEEPVLARDLRPRRASSQIDGLGGSYGVERLTFYQMLPEMGPPETTIWEYPRGDRSWALEFAEFLDDIRLEPRAVGGPRRRARRARRRRSDLPASGTIASRTPR